MLTVKEDVTITDANNLLHSLAIVLTEEARSWLYEHVQEVRLSGEPGPLVEDILKFVAQGVRD